MITLFPVVPDVPQGFQYVPDFISDAEERDLGQEISRINLHALVFQGYEAKRKVASFGKGWNFESQRLTYGKGIPQVFHSPFEGYSLTIHFSRA